MCASHATARWAPIGLGAVLIAVSLIVATVEINIHAASPLVILAICAGSGRHGPRLHPSPPPPRRSRAGSPQSRQDQETPRRSHSGSLGSLRSSWGGPVSQCWPRCRSVERSLHACSVISPSTHTMVVYGDSHAGMWFQTLNSIAKLIPLAPRLPGKGLVSGRFPAVPEPFGIRAAGRRILRVRPMAPLRPRPHQPPSSGAGDHHPGLLKQGPAVVSTLAPNGKRVWPRPSQRFMCLEGQDRGAWKHAHTPLRRARVPFTEHRQRPGVLEPDLVFWRPLWVAEKMAASREARDKDHYVNVTRWFCANTCPAVIGKYEVYFDQYHITAAYASFLAGVLAKALPLSLPSGFFSPPTTTVVIPSNGVILSGRQLVDATASPT